MTHTFCCGRTGFRCGRSAFARENMSPVHGTDLDNCPKNGYAIFIPSIFQERRMSMSPAPRGQNARNIALRYLFFTLGLLINSFGIAFITKSSLGTSQISSLPYVLSLRFPLSFGGFTFIMNTVFILIQIAIQRRDFPPVQLLQIAANVLFSAFIDVSMAVLSWLHPAGWLARGGCMLLGCAILACGISIEIAPDVITVPGEGLVRVLAQATGKDFGRVKLVFDVTLIVIASALSLLFFGRLQGVGIGTVVSALVVGPFVSLFGRVLPGLGRIRALRI